MKQQFFFSFLLLFLQYFTTTFAQSPAASPAQPPKASRPPSSVPPLPPAATPIRAPALPTPTDVIKILEKAGHFSILIRLLKSTQEVNHLRSVLKSSSNSVTIFAPSDSAFASLKSGTLNSLSEEDKSELVMFHILTTYLSTTQFQTVTNPLETEAGRGDRLQLNITTYSNSVNISTGLTNTSISDTVYTDNQLAIYQIDKVLLPIDIFSPKAPAPAPASVKEKPTKKGPAAESPAVQVNVDQSVGVSFKQKNPVVFHRVAVVVAAIFLCDTKGSFFY